MSQKKIPIQLHKERFIRINSNNPDKEKAALEKGWPTETNYDYDTFHTDFPNDPSYGVLCGNNNLMVIDCDHKEVQDILRQNDIMNETFITKTAGKQLYHFYFHVILPDTETDPKGFRADNEKGERIFDLQGTGTYVLGPNSTLLSGRSYEIVNAREIAEIRYQELKTILTNLIPKSTIIDKRSKEKLDSPMIDFDEICVAIKDKIKISDLLPKEIRTEPGTNTHCPLGHTTQGGQCFSHTKTLGNCFHCGWGGNIFQLYQQMNSCTFQEAKRELAKMAGLDDNFKVKVLTYYGDAKTKHMAAELLSTEIVKINNIKTIRHDKDNEMWIYKNGIYVAHGKTYIKEFVKNIMGPLYNTNFVNRVIANIEATTFVEQKDFFINDDILLIPVLNGILNIKTKQLKPFSPEYIFFNKLQIIYDPIQRPDKTITFMSEIVKDEENINLLQELFGYLLYRDYNIEKAFMFIGGGRNGKGKLLRLIETFIGSPNTIALSLQEITKPNSYDTEKLFSKYVNIGGDIPKTKIGDTSKLKQFTGRDPVTCMRKFLSPITFINYAKFIFACNELPDVDDSSEGYFDRWIKIDFPYKFVDNPVQPNERKIDINVLSHITSEAEMSGLLNWALEGLERLQAAEHFTETEDNKFTQESWKQIASSFAFFLDEEITEGTPADYVTVADLNLAYKNFCKDRKLRPDKMNARKEALQNMGLFQGVRMTGHGKTRIYPDFKFINEKNIQKFDTKEEELKIEDLE